MNTNFKNQISNIRKEATKIGFSKTTMDGYQFIWNNYIKWKQTDNFTYNQNEYAQFLLEHYDFDVSTFSNKTTKSWFQQLMRSKKILDNFNDYKSCITREVLPRELYSTYSSSWENTFTNYEKYCLNVRQNSRNTTKTKVLYAKRISSWLYQNKITQLSNITSEDIFMY